MPFHCLRNVTLEQPVFGANYLKGAVLAQPNGNWIGDSVFKLTFNRGGCIEFGEALLNAVRLASQYQPYISPPPYAPPAGGMFSAPPSYYTTSGNAYNGLNIPNQAFPDAPPRKSQNVVKNSWMRSHSVTACEIFFMFAVNSCAAF
uniref:Postacrosomal sheath WW domain-binding protein n=1 Tax=Romanomermis culicivorax TaxID=13658 RepID=A0A915J928_ROMCU